jgi:glycerol-3-phosphate acyltransferase PlsY
MNLFITLIAAYILGSIPTGYIIGKIHKIDIRKHGSGNTGATNVYRTLGKKWGIITFIFDFMKGFIPTYISFKIFPNAPYTILLTAISAVFGHIFSVFLNFKGGKGVATATGSFIVILPVQILISLVFFIIIVRFTKTVSVATLSSTFIFLITSILIKTKKEFMYMAVFISAVIFLTHIPNIKRLIKGEELKYSSSSGSNNERN